MITKVIGKGFKGLDFEQPLDQYTLFCGPNGAGKSARTQALTLAILGYLPKDQQKQAGAIFATHAAGDELSVGFEIVTGTQGKAHTFGRRYRKSGDTAIQEVFCDKKKLTRGEIEKTLLLIGDPRIFDLSAFMELSDNKKVEYLLNLFPPEQDLSVIDDELEALGLKEAKKEVSLKAVRAVIERLTGERAQVQASGTLPEVQAQIKEKEEALAVAEKELAEIETQEREKKAADKAEAEAKKTSAQALKEAEQKAAVAETKVAETTKAIGKLQQKLDKQEGQLQSHFPLTSAPAETGMLPTNPAPVVFGYTDADLTRILETMRKAGCGTICAATIVIKSLMARGRKEAA